MTNDEATDRLFRILKTIEVKIPGLEIHAVKPFGIQASLQAMHRDGNGSRIRIIMDEDLLSELTADGNNDWLIIRRCRDLLGRLIMHELDESFLVAGRRVYDPHEQVLP